MPKRASPTKKRTSEPEAPPDATASLDPTQEVHWRVGDDNSLSLFLPIKDAKGTEDIVIFSCPDDVLEQIVAARK